ncbi:MAG: AbrB/MazE/SpoVT family DNA-binding domain-containing protein [Bacillaceae bacterium]|uniref:SpoVT-AbrB domain-containing protein n=1 Tax=Alkalihalobacillus alcalophilus ATCC 27647 = CGMCC 1.3604 TaxID=1218173 RepID=A0A094WK14_ALKAL|nr:MULTISPECIES: AbrB/MazE/SpoVT family DNA-binding domain-containing protein [Bacillaceae]KGA96268.1 hypothetical protein BALCAV_0217295 [Alkalihalobacillus alcalophilus ATCC 27647 = CGMCC 1.3604]MDX5476057.1 AbrB/MazE/SpoVT family DNA-binding domain-containing protein [Bacillaceae bacterium]MED1563596.1 AbrB/MazE/SpoVT family DNA-binding domain-containing protein [Alkalihalobacillus alcalophilus]THG89557.1 hypothetical protein AJ85_16750 [Alkalihalobacillus alcalophilus ATCC 27647 = CGMCC 1.3
MLISSNFKEKVKELTDSNLMCSLKDKQHITIPSSIRRKLNILPGEEVAVGLADGLKDLIIKKNSDHSLDNKMIVSERGSIRIPTELTRALGLCKGDVFHIYLLIKDNCILLKKEN